MPHEFELSFELPIDAAPEQVWDAISTGPGTDSWFMGRTEIEPREGGATSFTMMGSTTSGEVTAWEPGRRFAYRSAPGDDGTFMAMETIIEARAGGSTVVRLVHSGFLSDDWEAEYDALRVGDAMYLRKLKAYVENFGGRFSTVNVFLPHAPVTDAARVGSAFRAVFGLDAAPAVGDKATVTVEGLAPAPGVVDEAQDGFVGVRTGDGFYRLMHPRGQAVVVEYHGFAGGEDGAAIERAWSSWLTTTFA